MARSSKGTSKASWRPLGPDPRDALAPLERALLAPIFGSPGGSLNVVTDDGGEQQLSVNLFFREEPDLLPVDRAALALCRGRVLDVGAGVGALALPLQAAGHEVTALEVLPGAVALLQERGVRDVQLGDLWAFRSDSPYDTVLALMNGTAAAGTLAGLAPLLGALAAPLAAGGQVLVDSTDLREEGVPPQRPDGRYVGEVQFQLSYGGERGPPFPQLFVDSERLADAAAVAGLIAEIVWLGEDGAFLMRLVHA